MAGTAVVALMWDIREYSSWFITVIIQWVVSLKEMEYSYISVFFWSSAHGCNWRAFLRAVEKFPYNKDMCILDAVLTFQRKKISSSLQSI